VKWRPSSAARAMPALLREVGMGCGAVEN
jgi:hypothetical protein